MAQPALGCEVARTIEELRAWRAKSLLPGQTLGFVPTMGALHEGHVTLIDAARKSCDKVLVSIFVNPLQFGPNEDFSKYPRTFEKDAALCHANGVDVIFNPSVDVIYPGGQEGTKVLPAPHLLGGLCAAYRPGHFEGVATVVNKLFNMVDAHFAFFGEKDYQQLQVVRHMVDDLNMSVSVVGVPTARESDGLALSSRNVYLKPQQRQDAPQLYRTLCQVRDDIIAGNQISAAVEKGRKHLQSIAGVTLQYLECCDPHTLQPAVAAENELIVLVAAKYGDVRLIDNLFVNL